jgi:7-cyano-7-deazaguanine synthase
MNLNPTSPDENGPVPSSFVSSERAIVLLSGGLDSTVALALAQRRYEVLMAVTFNYGQRAYGRELRASKKIALHYNVPHEVIALPWLSDRLPPAMAEARPGEPEDGFLADPLPPQEETRQVWVPNRNGLFLNIAASLAEAHQASVIVFGANAEEAQNFPDNTPAFRERLNAVFEWSTLNQVRVETPVGHCNKQEIIEIGVALDAPLEQIWSCYDHGPVQCGVCPSCRLLKQALRAVAPPSEADKLTEKPRLALAIPFKRAD